MSNHFNRIRVLPNSPWVKIEDTPSYAPDSKILVTIENFEYLIAITGPQGNKSVCIDKRPIGAGANEVISTTIIK